MTIKLSELTRARNVFEAVCGEAPEALHEAIRTARISGKIEIENGKPVPAWTGYAIRRADGRYYMGLRGFEHWREKPEEATVWPKRDDAEFIAKHLRSANAVDCEVIPANRIGERTCT